MHAMLKESWLRCSSDLVSKAIRRLDMPISTMSDGSFSVLELRLTTVCADVVFEAWCRYEDDIIRHLNPHIKEIAKNMT